MKITVRIILGIVVLFAIAAAFWIGVEHGNGVALRMVRNQFLADVKIAVQRKDGQLMEYLKARYYYYSNESGIRLRRSESDFGPVNEQLLQGYSAGKGLTSFKAEYDAYKQIPGFAE